MTILSTHRGYTVTDEPYGAEPFTIYTPDGRVLDHCDELTVKECEDTIDVVENQHQATIHNGPAAFFSKRGGYPETYI
jgi:hypothetical protein